MKVRYLLILALIVLIIPIHGKVVVKSSYKNNEGSLSEVIVVDDAKYHSSTLLLPYTGYMGFSASFMSTGSGEGNGDVLHSIEAVTNVKSKNEVFVNSIGGVSWGKNVEVSNGRVESQLNFEVNSGNCILRNRNGGSGVLDEIKLNNTKLNAVSRVSDDEVYYTSSIKPDGEESGFSTNATIESNGKVAEVETFLESKHVEKVPPLDFDYSFNVTLDNNGNINEEVNVYSRGFQINTEGEKNNATSITTLIRSCVKNGSGIIIPTQYVPDSGKPLNVNVFPVEIPLEQKLSLDVNIVLK